MQHRTPHPVCLPVQLSPAAFPGGPLSWVREPVHYLDLGGIQATSLRDFGGWVRRVYSKTKWGAFPAAGRVATFCVSPWLFPVC